MVFARLRDFLQTCVGPGGDVFLVHLVVQAGRGRDGERRGLLVPPLGGAARGPDGEGEVRHDGRHQEEL